MSAAIREQPVPHDPTEIPRWLAQFQIGVLSAVRTLSQVRLVQGVELTGVVFKVGANTLSHKLGKLPRGWLLTRQSAVLGLFETDVQVVQRDPQFFYLTATAPGAADLWVF